MNAVDRVIQSREISADAISAALNTGAASSDDPAKVTGLAAIAAALVYVGDVYLLCNEPTVEMQMHTDLENV